MVVVDREIVVKEWVNVNIKRSSLHKRSLKELYYHYYMWWGNKDSLPVSKKKLSSELRKHFKNDIDLQKIIILNRSGLLFQGINIEDQNNRK
jgi:hypothetical protein